MSKIKSLFLALVLLTTAALAYNFDKTLPLPGKSIADTKLQADTMMPIYYYSLRVCEPGCQSFAITDTEVTKPKNNSTWTETWTVKACSRTARIPINFIQSETGTDYAIDYMNVKVAK